MRKSPIKSPQNRSRSPTIKSEFNKKQNKNVNLNQGQFRSQIYHSSHSQKSLTFKDNFTSSLSKSPLKNYDSVNDAILRSRKQVQLKQKVDSNKNEKLFNKIVFYQNSAQCDKDKQNFRVQAFFSDGSSVSWKSQTIIYLSQKAIKTKVNIVDSYRSSDLSIKFMGIIEKIRKYSDLNYELEQKLQQKINSSILNANGKAIVNAKTSYIHRIGIFKKYKIQQFSWQKCRVNQTKQGYEIQSNDQNAILLLYHDLFRIKVKYLQLSTRRKVKSKNDMNEDQQDNALDKYTFHPPTSTQVKKKPKQTQILYQYLQVEKEFSIFNLPQSWFFPIDQVWTHLLANKIIKHDFMYIDFLEQNIQIRKTTKMPPTIVIGQNLNQNENQTLKNMNLPLYGKPTHQEKCRWICFEYTNELDTNKSSERIMWLNSQSEENLFYDGQGFWKSSADGISILYKKMNCFDTIVKYHFNAIPLTIRLLNEPERTLLSSLNAFWSYIQHNKKIQAISLGTDTQQNYIQNNTKNADQIVFDQKIPQIGQFKAYGNGMIIGKFIDRSMLTLKGETITVIDDLGQSITMNINKKQQYADYSFDKNARNPYVKYRQHLNFISDFYERVFHYDKWVQKQQLLQGLDHLRVANEAFLNVCQNLKKT